jgi:hypothetical protein
MADSTRPLSSVIHVSAEWALQGKEEQDPGYRLLACSDGPLNGENFDQALGRYSPGTLQYLPQVTVSWLQGKTRDDDAAGMVRNYVGLAIHQRPDRDIVDFGGRQFVQTSYFCVPFTEMAVGTTSYFALYDAFRQHKLPPPEGKVIQANLRTDQRVAQPSSLTLATAAWLLTDRTICVLGADQEDFTTRLRFIDDVMTLLPYGMRSRLSASTWTASTYRAHKFRLFFSNADRAADDVVLLWDEQYEPGTGIDDVDRYMRWLEENTLGRQVQLADRRVQSGFSPAEVTALLQDLGLRPPPPKPQVRRPSVEELLERCHHKFEHGDGAIGEILRHLRFHADNFTAEVDRQRYMHLIMTYRLLRRNAPLGKSTRPQFYDVVLRLAVPPRLSYKLYCELEDHINKINDSHLLLLPEDLARSVFNVTGGNEMIVLLLLLSAISDSQVPSWLRQRHPPMADIAEVVANSAIRPYHGQIAFLTAKRNLRLELESSLPDRNALISALQPHGFLARSLQRLYPGKVDWQRDELTEVLTSIYVDGVDGEAIAEILQYAGQPPTPALFAAVLHLVRRELRDVERAVWCLAYGTIQGGGLGEQNRVQLTSVLNNSLPTSDNVRPQPKRMSIRRKSKGPTSDRPAVR